MPAVVVALLAFVGLILSFTAVWIAQLHSRNAGMIDPVWAATLGGVAVFVAVLATGPELNRALVAAGGGIWGCDSRDTCGGAIAGSRKTRAIDSSACSGATPRRATCSGCSSCRR